jgi:toxin ParE1/3/4
LSARYKVRLTEDAAGDLEELGSFLLHREGPLRANEILDRLEDLIEALGRLPTRGKVPPELARLGIAEFRQVVMGPWRIVYRVDGRVVHVMLIADGRRDMQTLLLRRLTTNR